ncbi:hypothetical protein [Acidovorax sp.]|uniref:hypothetical protein n=1 Tax=Acidovorax sp. TaxID=1872122 RepID=UPI00391D0B68
MVIGFGYAAQGEGHVILYAINFAQESDIALFTPWLTSFYPGTTWAPQNQFPENCWVNWVRDTPEGEWYNPNPATEAHTPDLS